MYFHYVYTKTYEKFKFSIGIEYVVIYDGVSKVALK